jgi:hypothetical protein
VYFGGDLTGLQAHSLFSVTFYHCLGVSFGVAYCCFLYLGGVFRLYAAPFVLFFRPLLAFCEGGVNKVLPFQKKKKHLQY